MEAPQLTQQVQVVLVRVMHRSRRASLKKEPLDRATGVGLTLPSFNFVEPQIPRTPRRSNQSPSGLPQLGQRGKEVAPNGGPDFPSAASSSAPEKTIDFDEILYFTISKWAAQMHEPSL